MTEVIHPETGMATARLLHRLGYEPTLLRQQCCGQPAFNSGDWDSARTIARQAVEAIEAFSVPEIVSGANSCVGAIGADYQDVFRDEPAWRRRAAQVSARVVDMTTFLSRPDNLEKVRLLAAGRPPLRVTYHDCCQSLTALGLKSEGRRILQAVGCEVAEMANCEECCGFGGSFTYEHPEVSERIVERKFSAAADTGARVMVTDNSGCVMHLDGAARMRGDLLVVHILDLVAERTRPPRQSI